MGSHQAGRRLLATALVVTAAACSPSAGAEEDRLGAALGEELAAVTAAGEMLFASSREEAMCWGDAIAAELGVERWRQLGVFAPDYDFPDDMAETDDDIAAFYEALRRCLPDQEVIRRLISSNVELLRGDGGPLLDSSEVDCLAAEIVERAKTPLQFLNDLLGGQPEFEAAYTACGLEF